MPDPRRATPRTDHVLADERLQAAATRLGPVLVKLAVTAALERCRAGELDPAGVCTTQVMGAHASVVVAAMITEGHLRCAMLTRNVIGQAQGMLMERHGMSADAAFALLRRHSQHTNVKLAELARRMADSGIVPDIDGRD